MSDRERAQPLRNLIARSAIARGVSSAGRRIESAGSHSRSLQAAAIIARAWRRMDRGQRRRAIGVALVTAAAIHCALTALDQVPAGWMWLVLPAIAVAEGVVLVAASGPSTADHS